MFRKIVMFTAILAILGVGIIGAATAQSARDYITIVGSSTVYRFVTVVAELFGKTTQFKTPKIESTGSGGGTNATGALSSARRRIVGRLYG